MNCSRELIEGYLDEELEPGIKSRVEEHLAGCPSCSETYAKIREQQGNIRSMAPYYAAPAQLQQSVREALRQAAAQETAAQETAARETAARETAAGETAARETAAPDRNVPWRWLAIAASLFLAVSLAWNISQLRPRAPGPELMAQNIVSSHVRSLIGTHLLDVVSTDRHTVKPWFAGKLDFSPDVKDLASQGFPLIGGRIEYLSDRAVAALVFRRRQHVINLFTWPSASSDAKESRFARNGYNVLEWSDGSMTYWAVSDVASAEVRQFKELYVK